MLCSAGLSVPSSGTALLKTQSIKMSYQITNTGASLRFISGDGFFFLMKHHIKSIHHIRDSVIRINIGCCMHSIYIDADQVAEPATGSAEQLADTLNQWTTSFLQGYPPTIPGSLE